MGLRSVDRFSSHGLALLAFLIGAGTSIHVAKAQGFGSMSSFRTRATVEGHVRSDQGGPPPPGTMVFLKTLDGEIVEQQPTNPTGGFEIQDVPKAIYEVTIRVKGFRPYERQINLSYGAGEYFLNIQLTPRATVVHRSSPSLTDLRAPKAARKELARGQQALNKRQAREAERFLKAAVKIYPCYARAQTDLGLTLSTLHQYKSAEAALRKAIHCDPGYLESYTVLGQLLNAEQRYADSEEVLENGLRLSPGSWQFYYGLGKADFGEGKYQAALQQFQKAEGMTPPAPPNVHLKLADAYVKLTAFDHAYREFATYLRVQPHGPFAPGVKRVMRQMRAAGVLHSSLTQDSGSSASPR